MGSEHVQHPKGGLKHRGNEPPSLTAGSLPAAWPQWRAPCLAHLALLVRQAEMQTPLSTQATGTPSQGAYRAPAPSP